MVAKDKNMVAKLITTSSTGEKTEYELVNETTGSVRNFVSIL